MNIIVVKDKVGVDIFKKWSEVKEQYPTLNKDSDFVKDGEDYTCILDRESYQVVKDIKLLESVATEKVFGKKEIDWLTVMTNGIVVFVLLLMMG